MDMAPRGGVKGYPEIASLEGRKLNKSDYKLPHKGVIREVRLAK